MDYVGKAMECGKLAWRNRAERDEGKYLVLKEWGDNEEKAFVLVVKVAVKGLLAVGATLVCAESTALCHGTAVKALVVPARPDTLACQIGDTVLEEMSRTVVNGKKPQLKRHSVTSRRLWRLPNLSQSINQSINRGESGAHGSAAHGRQEKG